MPKLDGPIRSANQAVVAGSASTNGSAPIKNAASSASFPVFASSAT